MVNSDLVDAHGHLSSFDDGDRVRLKNYIVQPYPRHVLNGSVGTVTEINRGRIGVDFGEAGEWVVSQRALHQAKEQATMTDFGLADAIARESARRRALQWHGLLLSAFFPKENLTMDYERQQVYSRLKKHLTAGVRKCQQLINDMSYWNDHVRYVNGKRIDVRDVQDDLRGFQKALRDLEADRPIDDSFLAD